MKVKKYTAASMPEAMKKIRAELGEQAVLLQSKTVYTGGFLGLFKKKLIEVVAAVDPNSYVVPQPKEPAAAVSVSKNSAASQPSHKKNSEEELTKELKELKQLVQQFSKADQLSLDTYPEELKLPLLKMKKQEITDELILELKQVLFDKWKEVKGQVSEEMATVWSRQWLIDKIKPIQEKQPAYPKKFINIIGPTGVGKTTTLAKMAAGSVLEQKFKTAFITTDTYRIAAIDQLKTYADLLKVPVEVAYKSADIKQAIEKFKDYDIVYIDTAGRNYREEQFVKELKAMIPFERMKNYLVIALTSKEEDMYEIIDQFATVPVHQLIFTKMDETTSRGSIVNAICRYRKSIAFITNGQNVPDDLIQPDAEKIADIILGEVL
ncbi:flagellar biosynthesis protein FlhF [Bacillus aerolatus]|uniref:Flagellar biosynthesis protein FlhF n=1 Tax=Bacillus aerolatus TaxID=2653354 RepID=A0A6I1FY87_9BACI|nr:flagellar biosynthesis protein FlhF [Bacillus aerolatus]KAB7708068.1 flagellar biosynthesis protein FlhF [Bacillus aerolatus]